ncbi:VacJ family lipoprotein [Haliea sp. E1-2-M8]|uniref:MlaA family lipoprotein n=1 Tax=Haliea sp. E1-2-M8 TaxID=3064706 RepID=UPI0027189A4E|nr:VacJ family lipoprotein [Haliea sp. E1-2-M8]MDO8861199.1 VacJ family lipoprotein [Haliea sp. E1-2-M8]
MKLLRPTLGLLCLLLFAPAMAQETVNPDPWEGLNRPIFEFNERLDQYLLKPTAKGYQAVMPDPAEKGVGNFFRNLRDANSTINAVLQGRPGGVARAGGRFLLNSTIGMLGLFDVASRMGVEPYRTDFGHTLAIWGLPSGPYVMVPLFGPRTVRSGTGSVFDALTSVEGSIDDMSLRNSLRTLDLVDSRARLLRVEDLISGDRYIFVRDAYLQQRRSQVSDGVVADDFSDFNDAEWDEEF